MEQKVKQPNRFSECYLRARGSDYAGRKWQIPRDFRRAASKQASDNKVGSAVCLKPIACSGRRNDTTCARAHVQITTMQQNRHDLPCRNSGFTPMLIRVPERHFVPAIVKNRNGRRCVHPHERTYRTREFYRANQNNDRQRCPQLHRVDIFLQYVEANQA